MYLSIGATLKSSFIDIDRWGLRFQQWNIQTFLTTIIILWDYFYDDEAKSITSRASRRAVKDSVLGLMIRLNTNR